jgi:hypothetical protein
VQAAGGSSNGKDAVAHALGASYQKAYPARLSRLQTEKDCVYRLMKTAVPEAQKQRLYEVLGVDGHGKRRKQQLLERLWAEPSSVANQDGSLLVMRAAREQLLREQGRMGGRDSLSLGPGPGPGLQLGGGGGHPWRRVQRCERWRCGCGCGCDAGESEGGA